jgi:hypothetical protein
MTTMNNAPEEALRRYCSPSLVREYDKLGDLEKKALREAMTSCQIDNLLQFSMADGGVPTPSRKRVKSGACPLVRAFVGIGVHESILSEDSVERCRTALRSWGDIEGTTPQAKLFSYQQKITFQKMSPQYQNTLESEIPACITNTSSVKSGGAAPLWTQLRRIHIRDMILFGTSWG